MKRNHRIQVSLSDDEYEVFKAYARIHDSTIASFARRGMRSEMRKRLRDKYWQRHPAKNIVELAKIITADKSDEDFVYFVKCGEYIKIGYSTDVEARITGMMCDNPNDLELLACFHGNRITERILHESFSHCRHRNEWFHAGNDIYEFINAMRKIADSVLCD